MCFAWSRIVIWALIMQVTRGRRSFDSGFICCLGKFQVLVFYLYMLCSSNFLKPRVLNFFFFEIGLLQGWFKCKSMFSFFCIHQCGAAGCVLIVLMVLKKSLFYLANHGTWVFIHLASPVIYNCVLLLPSKIPTINTMNKTIFMFNFTIMSDWQKVMNQVNRLAKSVH